MLLDLKPLIPYLSEYANILTNKDLHNKLWFYELVQPTCCVIDKPDWAQSFKTFLALITLKLMLFKVNFSLLMLPIVQH